MINIRKIIINKVFPSMPGGLLLISLLSSYGIIIPSAGYMVGYSLYTSVFFILTFSIITRYKYCFVPLWCSIGLFIMGLVDWQKEFTNYNEYSILYDTCITIFCISVIGFIYINKKNEAKEYQIIKRSP